MRSSSKIMTRDVNTIGENDGCGPEPRGWGLYLSLLVVQTGGAVLLLVNIIPLYRMMALDFSNYRPDASPWWSIVGVLLIQIAYWPQVRLQPLLPRRGHIVLSHVVAFAAKMLFVAVTAAFTQVFLNRLEALRSIDYPRLRALAVLIMFFSLFCWTSGLERLAKALQGGKREASETDRD